MICFMSRSYKSKKQKRPFTCDCYYCQGDFSKYLREKDKGRNQMLESDTMDKKLSLEEESADQFLYYLSGEDTYADKEGRVISDGKAEKILTNCLNNQKPLTNNMDKEEFKKLWKDIVEERAGNADYSSVGEPTMIDTCSEVLQKALVDAGVSGECLALEVPKEGQIKI